MGGNGAPVRHVFPGGNTSKGFYSFYDHVTGPKTKSVYIIKGGPGVGKSTLMRRLAEEFTRCGHAVEQHHCSADNNSLDGVVVPALGLALIDGTAPHVVDPKYPGAIDTIVHLGDFWDEAAMRQERENIVAATLEVGRLFRRAYGYLAAAKLFHDQWEAAYRDSEAVDFAGLNRTAEALSAELFLGRPSLAREGRARHLFASAITYDGLKHHFDSLFGTAPHRVIVVGPPGTGKTTFIQRLADLAVFKGYDIEVFHDALDPSRFDHLLLPGLGIAVVNGAEPHPYPAREGDRLVETEEFLQPLRLLPFKGEIETAKTFYEEALTTAIDHLHRAKEVHDELERCYIPHMDFAAIERRQAELLDHILATHAEA